MPVDGGSVRKGEQGEGERGLKQMHEEERSGEPTHTIM